MNDFQRKSGRKEGGEGGRGKIGVEGLLPDLPITYLGSLKSTSGRESIAGAFGSSIHPSSILDCRDDPRFLIGKRMPVSKQHKLHS